MKLKKILFFAALQAMWLVPVLMIQGCTPSTTNPQTLAPGYQNSADQTMGEVLASAHAFYVQIQTNIQQGTYTPSAAEKASLNAFAATLNTAQAAYLAYHAGTQTQAQAQTAVNQVQSQQASLTAQIAGK